MNEIMRRLLFLPEQASTFAHDVDNLHYFVITVTMVSSLAVGLTAIAFFWKYRRRHENQATPFVAPTALFEVLAISVPLFFFLVWFAIGFRDFVKLSSPPPEAMDVYVQGKQWMWKFAYPEGPNSIGVLHVPANRPVRLLITSRDVIHSFYIPAFRVKRDVVPGRYTNLWFEATAVGEYNLFCTEYCGDMHSRMFGLVKVVEPEYFESILQDYAKLEQNPGETLEGFGKRIAEIRGCGACHSITTPASRSLVISSCSSPS